MIVSVPVVSAARAVSGNSGTKSLRGGSEAVRSGKTRLLLDVSAASGTSPTLNVTIKALFPEASQEASIHTKSTLAGQIGAFAQKTAVGQESLVLDCCPDEIQLDWAIAGTSPSFTFSVTALSE